MTKPGRKRKRSKSWTPGSSGIQHLARHAFCNLHRKPTDRMPPVEWVLIERHAFIVCVTPAKWQVGDFRVFVAISEAVKIRAVWGMQRKHSGLA